jgi:pyrimidine-nucleoside phosphorylase/thymidine phosphorylase
LAAELLQATGQANDRRSALQTLASKIDSGAALERFERLVAAQGGQLPAPVAAATCVVWAPHSGRVTHIACRVLGQAMIDLGGGRKQRGDSIDPAVGLEMLVRLGDDVQQGQPIVRIFARTVAAAESVAAPITRAFRIDADDRTAVPPPLICERLLPFSEMPDV